MSLVFGAVAVVAFLWIWLISVETPFNPPEFNPPEWLRIAGSSLLPVGIGGAVGAGVVAFRYGDRVRALVGIGLAVVPLVGFIVLVSIYE
jgi:hypothetical protein